MGVYSQKEIVALKMIKNIVKIPIIFYGEKPFFIISFGAGLGMAVLDIIKKKQKEIYFIDLSSKLNMLEKITIIDYVFTMFNGILLFWASISNPYNYLKELKKRNHKSKGYIYLKGLNEQSIKDWQILGYKQINDLNEIYSI
ncbi:MAG: hypothetical protein GY849_02165 [Deltaproteobacteria bacterium]|nr:hypothetical protein [Deltaproteobacteria bacterium]